MRWRREDGGLSAEWLAVGALVVILLAALGTSGIAQRMGESFAYAACRIISSIAGEGECTPPGSDGDGVDGPTMTCLDSRTTENVGGHITLFSVRVDGDLSYQIDRMSDGTYEVTLQMSGGLGAEFVAGGKLNAEDLGLDNASRSGSVTAGATGEVAPVFSFDSLEDAENFAESARDLVAGPMDDIWDPRTLIPIYGPGRVVANQIDRIRNFDMPDPSGLRIQGGLEATAEGSISGGGASVNGLLGGGRHLGADIDFETGNTTIYVALDQEIAAGLGFDILPGSASGGVGADGELTSEVMIGLTVDEDMNPVELGVNSTIAGSGGFDGFGGWDDLHEVFTGLPEDFDLGINRSEHDAFSLTSGATLDLTDPRLAAIGDDVLDAISSGNAGDLASAGGDLLDHMLNETDLEVQLHTGDESGFDIEGKGGKGIAFGGGFEHGRSDMELAGAWHRPPGGEFTEATCA